MATSKDAAKALKDSTSATVNTLKRTGDANEKVNPGAVKKSKQVREAPNFAIATPPKFLKDIVLPDEDDVYPLVIHY